MTNEQDMFKHVGDYVAATITVGALVEWIPVWVAILNLAYISMRIYDWIERRCRGKKSDEES